MLGKGGARGWPASPLLGANARSAGMPPRRRAGGGWGEGDVRGDLSADIGAHWRQQCATDNLVLQTTLSPYHPSPQPMLIYGRTRDSHESAVFPCLACG